ncbi:MAG: hypothetical protein ACXVEE_31575 [Polyangiales bacterium]
MAASAGPESDPIAAARTVGDFLLRLAYFVLAPIAIVSLARLVPIIGIVVNVAIALVVFAFAEAVRSLVVRYPILARVLAGALRFEQHYRTHAPKPFLYYALYPLLFPYWLSNATARREFALFRNLGAVGLIILLGGGAWDYYAHWQPELRFGQFLVSWTLVFVFQTVVTMMFVMPLATSVVTLELAGQRKRLFVLLGAAAVVVAIVSWSWAKKRHEFVQLPTAERMMLRTQAQPKRAREVRSKALQAAWNHWRQHEGEAVKEGKHGVEILGAPIDAAREVLLTYYQSDETMAFHLVALETNGKTLLVLYGIPPSQKKDPVWIGVHKDGKSPFTSVDELPKDAFSLMRRAASH